MLKRLNDSVRHGAITSKAATVYILLWLLGVPSLLLVVFFLLGVGR